MKGIGARMQGDRPPSWTHKRRNPNGSQAAGNGRKRPQTAANVRKRLSFVVCQAGGAVPEPHWTERGSDVVATGAAPGLGTWWRRPVLREGLSLPAPDAVVEDLSIRPGRESASAYGLVSVASYVRMEKTGPRAREVGELTAADRVCGESLNLVVMLRLFTGNAPANERWGW